MCDVHALSFRREVTLKELTCFPVTQRRWELVCLWPRGYISSFSKFPFRTRNVCFCVSGFFCSVLFAFSIPTLGTRIRIRIVSLKVFCGCTVAEMTDFWHAPSPPVQFRAYLRQSHTGGHWGLLQMKCFAHSWGWKFSSCSQRCFGWIRPYGQSSVTHSASSHSSWTSVLFQAPGREGRGTGWHVVTFHPFWQEVRQIVDPSYSVELVWGIFVGLLYFLLSSISFPLPLLQITEDWL